MPHAGLATRLPLCRGVFAAGDIHRRVPAQFFPRERPTIFNSRTPRFEKENASMVNGRRLTQSAAIAAVTGLLFLATAAFAGGPEKAAPAGKQTTDAAHQVGLDNAAGGGRCAVAAPSPTPQTQQPQIVNVCTNWAGMPGAQVQLFNTTGQSCSITAGTTAWPFAQAAPLSIANGSGLFVTLQSPLASGGYNYNVSCCAGGEQPADPVHTVTVGDG